MKPFNIFAHDRTFAWGRIVQIAPYGQDAVLLLWIPLSYFVWRRCMWARWLVAYSALVLGIVQCVIETEPLTLYGAGLIDQAILFAVPAFFLSGGGFLPNSWLEFRRY